MPFLRRRVNASETDMRRHTTVIDPEQIPKNPQTAKFLTPEPTTTNPRNGNNVGDTVGFDKEQWAVGEDGKSSIETPQPRGSQDPFDRPESPPIQEETPKHRRFSMLRFRNASDSQLSTRLKQQQQQHLNENPPPMPERKYFISRTYFIPSEM